MTNLMGHTPLPKLKVVSITTDNREHDRNYDQVRPYFAAGHESLLQGFAQVEDVDLHVVCCTQRPMKSPDRLADNVWFHSLHVSKFGWLRTSYQGCIRAVRKKVRDLGPDLVHGHGTERDCALSATFSGLPNLVTIHGNMAELARLTCPRIGSYLWLAARLENFTLRRTAGVLCNSSYTQGLVRGRAARTWLVPHAVRQMFFETAPDPKPRPGVLLNAGVISPRKRQLELLGVVENLHRQGLKLELRFIGFLPSPLNAYAKSFLERIKPLEAAGYARFYGPQKESELVACYDDVSGMVHFPTEEAFGNVVVEALARELKFFGSRLGGIQDIASGIPGCELVDKDDWGGLTDAIASWVKRGSPRQHGSAAIIRQLYHPKAIARRHLDIYREVLSRAS